MWAMVLAGGRGIRLGHLTEKVSKPMIPIAGAPLLERQVRWLAAGGVTDILFLLVYKPESVWAHFREGEKFGVRIHYYVGDSLKYGTGGMVRAGLDVLSRDTSMPILPSPSIQALTSPLPSILPSTLQLPSIPPSPQFVVTNGDVLTDEPLASIPRYEDGHTILSAMMPGSYGVLETLGNHVSVFHEAPFSWINAGVYILHPNIYLPEQGPIERVLAIEAMRMRLYIHRTDKWWRSLDSFKDLLVMEEHFGEGYENKTHVRRHTPGLA